MEDYRQKTETKEKLAVLHQVVFQVAIVRLPLESSAVECRCINNLWHCSSYMTFVLKEPYVGD